MAGPLTGLRVIELAGIGPGPFGARLLADLGADVIRIDRPPAAGSGLPDGLDQIQSRGKRSIVVNLKDPAGVDIVLRLVEEADVLIDPMRPGVAERLGLGPGECLRVNPRLIYGRITGWGQDGPLADMAGHDINYIGLVGALHAIGRAGQRPVPPLNLVGDYGGGALYLAFGILAALFERAASGRGQVVDAAMVDGAASLMAPIYEMLAGRAWNDHRESNHLDGGAPYYDTFETADGGFLAVGPLEGRFYSNLLRGLGLEGAALPDQHDRRGWQELRDQISGVFKTRSRDEWEEVFAGVDACVTPVLSMQEAPFHPHNVARETFVRVDGRVEPAPAPRFGRTAADAPHPGSPVGADTGDVLRAAGFDDRAIGELFQAGIVAGPVAR